MGNPFDDENGYFIVLTNLEGQHSLWPDHIEIPAGWQSVHGPAPRLECLDFVEKQWTDLRPKSLIDAMEGSKT